MVLQCLGGAWLQKGIQVKHRVKSGFSSGLIKYAVLRNRSSKLQKTDPPFSFLEEKMHLVLVLRGPAPGWKGRSRVSGPRFLTTSYSNPVKNKTHKRSPLSLNQYPNKSKNLLHLYRLNIIFL